MTADSDNPTRPLVDPTHPHGDECDSVQQTDELAPFRSSLDEVLGVAQELNALAQLANRRITLIDKALKDAGVGLEIWDSRRSLYEYTLTDGTQRMGVLGYSKRPGTWGLAVRVTQTTAAGLKTESYYNLKALDRERRIDALQHVPALLKQLAIELRSTKQDAANKLAEV